jgi:hypothetical protein
MVLKTRKTARARRFPDVFGILACPLPGIFSAIQYFIPLPASPC